MSLKKRILRIGCISALLLAFVGYFAFSTFFFPPIGGKVKFDLAGLIPRDVDAYLSREDLSAAFDGFPTLAVWDQIEGHPAVRAYLRSEGYRELDAEHGFEARLADIRAQLDQIPLGLDPLGMVGGEDVAVAMDFTGNSFETSEWAVYARATFFGKLGVSLLSYPGLLGLDRQGISASEADDIVTLSGGQLAAPIHVTRIKDVVVAGTSRRMVTSAAKLENSGAQESLLLAAPYDDGVLGVETRNEDKRDFEVKLDVRQMRESFGMTKPWLDPKSTEFGPAFAARVLPLGAVRQLYGIVDFDQGLRSYLSGTLTSEDMTPAQETIYRAKGFERGELDEVARLAPADATLFAYMRAPIGVLAREIEASLEPALRSNLDATIKQVQGLERGTQGLIDWLDTSLVDRVAFFALPDDFEPRPMDFAVNPDTGQKEYVGPPNDQQDVFAWALVAWTSDAERINDLQRRFAAAGSRIGVQGRDPNSKGVFDTTIAGGLVVREFWSQLIPGTGHVALLIYGDRVILSNRYQFVEAVTQNAAEGAGAGQRLSESATFQRSLAKGLGSSNLALWLAPSTATDLIRERAKTDARRRLEDSYDFRVERPRVEREVLARIFPGKTKGGLNSDEQARLAEVVDGELLNERKMMVSENLEGALTRVDEMITYLDAVLSSLTMIRLDTQQFRVFTETTTPYDR